MSCYQYPLQALHQNQDLDLLKYNFNYVAEDPVPKDNASLKTDKANEEDDEPEPIMVDGFEDLKEPTKPKTKSKAD